MKYEIYSLKYAILFSLIILFAACKKDDDPQPPSTPIAKEASDVTNNGFTANWTPAAGANDYEVDVATDNSFNNLVKTIKNLGSSTLIDGLDGNTEYFYRVRATWNGANPSANSNTISVITMPDEPVAIAATNITNSGFTANWEAVEGIVDYVLYVSNDNIPADPPTWITGYDGVPVNGTSHTLTGLESGTIYYYAVRAKADARVSEFSNSVMIETAK